MKSETKRRLREIGVEVPKILLPRDGVEMGKWAVVACDQHTSEPEYWAEVEKLVENWPSTYRLTLPEVYLEAVDKEERIRKINETMGMYLDEGVVKEKFEGMVLVERQLKKVSRWGLMVALDLEKYDYSKGSKTLIRATEGTVVSRIPPRLEIRRKALMELPHIMVLIDDPGRTVIEPLQNGREQMRPPLYDFELMMEGGRIRGWRITDEETMGKIAENLGELVSEDGFLFAMGDGNHSLATAKAYWEEVKSNLSEAEKEDHPARFALVELVNVHDDGLVFEPIHRIVCGGTSEKLLKYLEGEGDEIEIVEKEGRRKMKIRNSGSNLVVGNLQALLDKYVAENPEVKIDYIHGKESVEKLAREMGGVGFLLPAMNKRELFPTVEKDGALPRKTFSMGEANEKRYYVEARKIV